MNRRQASFALRASILLVCALPAVAQFESATLSGVVTDAADAVISDAAPLERRSFLDVVFGVGFVSTAIAIAYPVARFLVPPESGGCGVISPASSSHHPVRVCSIRRAQRLGVRG